MFHNSCSNFAIQKLRQLGWNKAKTAILLRLDQCNGQYVMSFDGEQLSMQTSDGLKHSELEISAWLADFHKDRLREQRK